MTAEQKKWWRKVAAFAVGGGVVAGGLFGIVHATADPKSQPTDAEQAAWSRSAVPAPNVPAPVAPAVAETERTAVPIETNVVPTGATLPPLPVPAPPTGPMTLPQVPSLVGTTLPPVPAVPNIPAPPAMLPTGLEPPAPGPRSPDLSGEQVPLPAVPALPSPEQPKVPLAPDMKLPVPPGTPVVPPSVPIAPPGLPSPPAVPAALTAPAAPPTATMPPAALPALPTLPSSTAEPPMAVPVPTPTAPAMPVMPVVPQPTVPAQALPHKPAQPLAPVPPAIPDSGLNTNGPGNNFNRAPVAPALPIAFPPTSPGGRDVPGLPVDLAKPPTPAFTSTEKDVFPVPGRTVPSSTPRDAAMLNLKHTAALAVIGGAMLTAESARSAPASQAGPTTPVRADAETDKLKEDLKKANAKIEALEKQIAKLSELLTGKKDELGVTVPSDPGAVEELKRLKNRIAELDTELKALKTQTALKPSVATPESRPEGTVKVVNEYPVEISMVINDKSHRIAPGKVLEVKVPAGDFSYQLLQSGAAATRSAIKDKETVTLRIK